MAKTNRKNKSHKPKQKRGWVFKTVVALALLLTAGTATVVYMARSQPAYWKEHQRLLNESTPKQIQQLAGEVDAQLAALANLGLDAPDDQGDSAAQFLRSLTRPSTDSAEGEDDEATTAAKPKPEDVHINMDQTILLQNEQLSAVVQTRMDDWMADRGYVKPEGINDPMIAVSGGKLVMAFQLEIGAITQVISGSFNLKIRKDGIAEITMDSFLVGKLPVPVNAIGEHLRGSTGDERALKAGKWLEKLQYMEFKPVIELEHRRRARVQDYKLLEKGLQLTVRVQDHKTYKAMNSALAGVPTN